MDIETWNSLFSAKHHKYVGFTEKILSEYGDDPIEIEGTHRHFYIPKFPIRYFTPITNDWEGSSNKKCFTHFTEDFYNLPHPKTFEYPIPQKFFNEVVQKGNLNHWYLWLVRYSLMRDYVHNNYNFRFPLSAHDEWTIKEPKILRLLPHPGTNRIAVAAMFMDKKETVDVFLSTEHSDNYPWLKNIDKVELKTYNDINNLVKERWPAVKKEITPNSFFQMKRTPHMEIQVGNYALKYDYSHYFDELGDNIKHTKVIIDDEVFWNPLEETKRLVVANTKPCVTVKYSKHTYENIPFNIMFLQTLFDEYDRWDFSFKSYLV